MQNDISSLKEYRKEDSKQDVAVWSLLKDVVSEKTEESQDLNTVKKVQETVVLPLLISRYGEELYGRRKTATRSVAEGEQSEGLPCGCKPPVQKIFLTQEGITA